MVAPSFTARFNVELYISRNWSGDTFGVKSGASKPHRLGAVTIVSSSSLVWSGSFWTNSYTTMMSNVLNCAAWDSHMHTNTDSQTDLTDRPTNVKHTHTQSHKHACTHAYIHTRIHTHTHAHAHTGAHTHAHTHTRMYTDTQTHTHVHTRTYTHTHVHTHTHTCPRISITDVKNCEDGPNCLLSTETHRVMS